MILPHVIDGTLGGPNYQSVLGITNVDRREYNDVTITFSDGAGLALSTVSRMVPPGGSIRETARTLLGLPPGFQSGWVRITGSLPLTGFVAYADTVNASVAIVAPQTEPATRLLLSHIADLPPWLTGIAVLNTNSLPADVEIFAIAPNGSLIGGAANVVTARFVLDSGNKTARLLSEWIPQTQRRVSDGGFVFVRSTVPIYALQLFFSRDLKILSNVAAGRISSGIEYVPPVPPTSFGQSP
jgi:hypothetical protein